MKKITGSCEYLMKSSQAFWSTVLAWNSFQASSTPMHFSDKVKSVGITEGWWCRDQELDNPITSIFYFSLMHFSGLWIINSSIFFTFICDDFVAMVTVLKLCNKVHTCYGEVGTWSFIAPLQICPRFSLYIFCVCIQFIILREDNNVFLRYTE